MLNGASSGEAGQGSFLERMKAFLRLIPKSVDHPSRNLLSVLYLHAKEDGRGIYPGTASIMDMSGLSHTALHRHLQTLERAGYLLDDGYKTHSNGSRTKKRRIDLDALRRDRLAGSEKQIGKERSSDGRFNKGVPEAIECPTGGTFVQSADRFESPANGILNVDHHSAACGIFGSGESPGHGGRESPGRGWFESPDDGTQTESINRKNKQRGSATQTRRATPNLNLENLGDDLPNGQANPKPPMISSKAPSAQVTHRPDHVAEAVALWNEMAEGAGLAIVQKITDQRRAACGARLKDCGGIDGWRHAMQLVGASQFLTGKVKAFKADFDFIVTPSKFTKLMEGSYADVAAPMRAAGGMSAADRARVYGSMLDEARGVTPWDTLNERIQASGGFS